VRHKETVRPRSLRASPILEFREKPIFENLQIHLVSLHFAVNKIDCLIPKRYGLGLVWSFWVGARQGERKNVLLI